MKTILAFWAFYFVINTFRMAAIEAEGQAGMLVRRTVVSLVGILLTTLLWQVLRRFETKSMRAMVTAAFVASLPISFAYATVNFTAFYVVHPHDSELREMHEEHMRGKPAELFQIIDSALNWYFFVVAWAIMYIALSYAAKVRVAERAAAQYQAEAQTAQLRALRYQINPHFLFNTLNSLSSLVLRQRGDEAERMIMNLSHFFRTSLTTDPTEDVPLADEIRMQRLYLDIERIRFPDRLKVEIDVPAELEHAAVPGMLLQPLVENAIKYGVARSTRPVTVTIRARTGESSLNLTVEDDGQAAADTPLLPSEKGHGVGLRNVCDRLAARFGEAATCHYGARAEGGFRVALAMPLRMDPEPAA
ncbi:MAG TPA: histidine kinase [Alphaproteobacteria bacterium]|nr:histidine kinase [Alphaproteobacteria bacterium]